jgi:hypothetical protein
MDSPSRPHRAGRASRLTLLCAVLAAVAPSAADAAYAPRLSIAVEPATAASTVAITSTVSQAAGEEAAKKVRLSFPRGFGFKLAAVVALPTCSAAQFGGGACPENSRIGSVDADAGFPVGTVSGGVYYGGATSGAPTLYAFLSNSLTKLLGMDQKIKGTTEFRADGGADTVFDNLPNVATTRLTFAISGGDKGIVGSPLTCGVFTFKGAFTSQSGATATSETAVNISGCAPAPTPTPAKPRATLSAISLAKTVSAATGADAKSRANLKGKLTIRLRKASSRTPLVTKRVSVAAPGPITVHRVGRGLAPGTYVLQFSLQANGRTATRTRTFRVR